MQVFVSHHGSTRDLAEHVANFLERRGVSAWLAPRDVGSGQDWEAEVTRVMESSSALLLLFSRSADASRQIKCELKIADRLRLPVFILRLEDVQPDRLEYFLIAQHWVEWIDRSDVALEALVSRLGGDVATIHPGGGPEVPVASVEYGKGDGPVLGRVTRGVSLLRMRGARAAPRREVVMSLALATGQDGRTIAVTGTSAATAGVWDVTTGTRVGTHPQGDFDDGPPVATTMTQEGRIIALAGTRAWDVMTEEVVGKPPPITCFESMDALAAATAPDGRLVAIAGRTGCTAQVWDVSHGRPIGTPLTGHTGSVRGVALAWSADGRLVAATASADRTVRVWDAFLGVQIGAPLTGHCGGVESVALATTANGRLVAVTGGWDSMVQVWDALGGTPVGSPLDGPHEPFVSVALANVQGRLLAAGGTYDRGAVVWDVVSGARLWSSRRFLSRQESNVAFATAGDGRLILVVSMGCRWASYEVRFTS